MLGYWLFDADSSEPQGSALGSPTTAGTPAPRPLAQADSVELKR
jgi:hypothetical protein